MTRDTLERLLPWLLTLVPLLGLGGYLVWRASEYRDAQTAQAAKPAARRIARAPSHPASLPGARTVATSGFALPGLVDAHCHIGIRRGPIPIVSLDEARDVFHELRTRGGAATRGEFLAQRLELGLGEVDHERGLERGARLVAAQLRVLVDDVIERRLPRRDAHAEGLRQRAHVGPSEPHARRVAGADGLSGFVFRRDDVQRRHPSRVLARGERAAGHHRQRGENGGAIPHQKLPLT